MQVIFIENENPWRNSTGGIMTYLRGLAGVLKKNGNKTSLIGVGEHKPQPCDFDSFISVNKKPDIGNALFMILLVLFAFKRKFNRNDIIHFQRPDMLWPFYFSPLCRGKFIVTLHGRHDLSVRDQKSRIYYWIFKLMHYSGFKIAGKIIAVSQQTAKYYTDMYPFIQKKIYVIPTGINMEVFKPINKESARETMKFNKSEIIVLYIGRLEKEKNIQLIIHAFKHFLKSFHQSRLVLAGFGREQKTLSALGVELKIERNISFLGETDHNLIHVLASCADVFAFSSLYEGSPIVIKEVLACNLPVVSTPVGDIPELIDDLPGCFVSGYDSTEFSLLMQKAIQFSGKVNYREKIKEFNHENIGNKTIKIYTSLLKSAE